MSGMESAQTSRITPLSELVCNQIAAGEVIERPASVVKELVENALDAGATRIQVDLEEGGVKLVRVTDDGHGLLPADLELAFASHATSKLAEASDLDHIATLGFRGEALASIGSVARCRLRSRPRGSELGHEIENAGGRISTPLEAGAPEGTVVEMRDLFFNTPARRRFLKTTKTELGRCLDVIQRIALAHEGVGFVVTHNQKRVYDVEPEMDLLARVRRTFGAELAENLVPVHGADGDTRLSGWVAPPRFSRTDTSRQMWFLNGRPLRDKILIRCLRDAYRGFLIEGRQPVAFLSLSMDPAKVDVNVHPAKAEVRFRDQRRMFGFLVAVLREAVRSTDMSTPGERMMEIAARREAAAGLAGDDTRQYILPDPGPRPGWGSDRVGETSPAHDSGPVFVPRTAGPIAEGESNAPSLDPAQPSDELRGPFLQVAKTYLLRAVDDGFEIVDQHALHERLTLEEMKCDVEAGRVEVQGSLVPELVEVSPAQAELLEEHFDSLARIGVQLARFGERTISVNGLPVRLRHPDAEGLVRDVIEVIERTGKAPDAADVIEEVLHRAACRSSVMAGDVLSETEIRSLLTRARALDSDQTCPHARPTRVRFTLADLEKAFHRR